jgi:hemolysin activation/secretion protein
MQFARWAYDCPWNNSSDLRLGAASSYLSYRLGGSASSLNAYGSAKQHSFWLEQPVWSNPQSQLLWRTQYDGISMHDLEDTSGSDNDRHAQVLHLGLNLTHNNLTGQGQQWLNLDTGLGSLGFNNATAMALDSATADTQGRFVRFNLLAGMQHAVNDSLWSLNLQSQWSNHNLDSAQKMSVGGAHSVRAYAPGVLSGDNGHLLSAEYKQQLSPTPENIQTSGQWFAGAFIDVAWLTLYRHPYASGANDARLSGSGMYLSWQGLNGWQGKITLSRPFGDKPSQLDGSNSTHDSVWVELTKAFR